MSLLNLFFDNGLRVPSGSGILGQCRDGTSSILIFASDSCVAASTTRVDTRTGSGRSSTGSDGERARAGAFAFVRVRLFRPETIAGARPDSTALAGPVPIVPHPTIPIYNMRCLFGS